MGKEIVKPVESYNEGRAKIALFQNKTKDGGAFYTASLSSLYKDKEDKWVHGKASLKQTLETFKSF